MLIDATHDEETRVVVMDGNRLAEFDYESKFRKPLKGSIFLAKVTRVEPSLQAAFVNFGGNRHGFLPFAEIHPDYFRIPIADREALMAEQQAELEALEREEEELKAEEALHAQNEDGGEHGEDQDMIVVEPDSGHEHDDLDADDDHEDDEDRDDDRDEDDADGSQSVAALGVPTDHMEGQDLSGDFGNDNSADQDAGEEGDSEAFSDAQGEEGRGAEGEADENGQRGEQDHRRGGRRGRRGRGGHRHKGGRQPHGSKRTEVYDDEDDTKRFRFNLRRKYKIQEVIKRGQIMLVQVSKEERGNKGAAVTSYLSLPGRYGVLMPNSPRAGGVSRKISSFKDRARMRELLKELNIPNGMSVIMRTAGVERTKAEIKRDLDYLMRLWNNIREVTLVSSAPAIVYEEADLIKRAVRDLYTRDIEEIVVAGDEGFKNAKNFMKMIMPSHAKRVIEYKDQDVPLLNKYKAEVEIAAIGETQVTLPSGGYIVINPTEALVSIDVNSGKSTKERHIEETALKTNLEAAEEIARQLRLRDLGGLVVVDFIDMEDRRNNAKVERKMREALSTDRARTQMSRISMFGLMEMSRQRMSPSLTEAQFVACAECQGTGRVRSADATTIMVLRAIEDEGIKRRAAQVMVHVSNAVALYILNNKRKNLASLEDRYGFDIQIRVDNTVGASNFRVEVSKPLHKDGPRQEQQSNNNRDHYERDDDDAGESDESEESSQDRNQDRDQDRDGGHDGQQDRQGHGERSSSSRRRGRRGGRNRNRGGRNQGQGHPGERDQFDQRPKPKTASAEYGPEEHDEDDSIGNRAPEAGAEQSSANPRHQHRNREHQGQGRRDGRPSQNQRFEREERQPPQRQEKALVSESVEVSQPAPSVAPKPSAKKPADDKPTAASAHEVVNAPPANKKKGWWSRGD
jgi:ribonuclease E